MTRISNDPMAYRFPGTKWHRRHDCGWSHSQCGQIWVASPEAEARPIDQTSANERCGNCFRRLKY